MLKNILASVWILAALAVLILGLNGFIDAGWTVVLSLVALVLFYAFALWTVVVNTRDPQSHAPNSNESILRGRNA